MRLRALLALIALSLFVVLIGGCADLRDELQLAQGEVQELQKTKSELEAKITALEDDGGKLETKVSELLSSNKELKSKASVVNGKTAELQELVGKLKRDNAECRKNGQAFAKEATELKAKYTQLEKQLDLIKKKNDDLSKELTKLKSALSPAGEQKGTKPEPAPQSKDDSTAGKKSASGSQKQQTLAVSQKPLEPPKTLSGKIQPAKAKSKVLGQASGKDRAANSGQTKRNYSGRGFTKCYMVNGVPFPAFMSEIFSSGFHR